MNLRQLARHAPLAASAALLAWHASRYWFVTDDAYISFVYSRNLAEHGELVFNAGMDPVEGYTNFLWTVLLGVLAAAVLAPAALAEKPHFEVAVASNTRDSMDEHSVLGIETPKVYVVYMLDATPAGDTSRPNSSSIFAAGPLIASPPTMGDTARAGTFAMRSRTPGSVRIGSMLTNGLEGAKTMASAASSASTTSVVGRAVSAPAKRIRSTRGSQCRRTK